MSKNYPIAVIALLGWTAASLAGVASVLVMVFQAQTSALIPLYAIGVFLSFTLSQTGMAVRWWRCGHLKPGETIKQLGSTLHHEPNWKPKLAINGLGAVMSFVVMILFAITKFQYGAWIIVIVIVAQVEAISACHRRFIGQSI